jgi:septum formation protein
MRKGTPLPQYLSKMNIDKFQELKIILASQSPRRRELLQSMGLNFESIGLDINEDFPSELKEHEIPVYLSQKKAAALESKYDEETIIITADTIVWYNNMALNKPINREEAIQMLRQLNGQWHTVFTGVTVQQGNQTISKWDSTQVKFAQLEEQWMEYYVDHYHPMDKAGSYGAQDFWGLVAIEELKGSYYNVMGLPTHLVFQMLSDIIQKVE